MRLLLTLAGVNNQSIHDSLVSMLPKPIDECHALHPDSAVRPSTRRPRRETVEVRQRTRGVADDAAGVDDEIAIRVIDGATDVISEGQWRRFDH